MNFVPNHAPIAAKSAAHPNTNEEIVTAIFDGTVDIDDYDEQTGESLDDTDVETNDDDSSGEATTSTTTDTTTADTADTADTTADTTAGTTDETEPTDEATSGSPDGNENDPPFRIGGKVLSRDLCHLRGVAIAARRAYIVLSAASDAVGKFRLDDPVLDHLGIAKRDLSNLDKLGLIRLYEHEGIAVGYIPGGVSHAFYRTSKIAPDPKDLPSRTLSSLAGVALHRDRLALYDGLDNLEVSVFHILFNQADSHGRGLLSPATILGLIGRTKLRNGTWVTLDLISETVARLHAGGRLLTYTIKGKSYYAALDAKQHAVRFIPGSRVPPPAGQDWDFSFDSPENLEWYDLREPARKERKEKRKSKKAAKATAKATPKSKPASEMTPEEKMDKWYEAEPHKDFKHGQTHPAVFIRNVVEGRGGKPGEMDIALRALDDFPGATEWLEKNLTIPLATVRAVYAQAHFPTDSSKFEDPLKEYRQGTSAV